MSKESLLEKDFIRAFRQASAEFSESSIWRSARESYLPSLNGRRSPREIAKLLSSFAAEHPYVCQKLPTVYRLAEEVLAADQ